MSLWGWGPGYNSGGAADLEPSSHLRPSPELSASLAQSVCLKERVGPPGHRWTLSAFHPEGMDHRNGNETRLRAAHRRHNSNAEKVEVSEQVASLAWGRGGARRGLGEVLLKPVAAKRNTTPPEVWIPSGDLCRLTKNVLHPRQASEHTAASSPRDGCPGCLLDA